MRFEDVPATSAEALEALQQAELHLARVYAFLTNAYKQVGGSALARLADADPVSIKFAADLGWDKKRVAIIRDFLAAITKNLSGGPIPVDPVATGWRNARGRKRGQNSKLDRPKRPVGRPRKKP